MSEGAGVVWVGHMLALPCKLGGGGRTVINVDGNGDGVVVVVEAVMVLRTVVGVTDCVIVTSSITVVIGVSLGS